MFSPPNPALLQNPPPPPPAPLSSPTLPNDLDTKIPTPRILKTHQHSKGAVIALLRRPRHKHTPCPPARPQCPRTDSLCPRRPPVPRPRPCVATAARPAPHAARSLAHTAHAFVPTPPTLVPTPPAPVPTPPVSLPTPPTPVPTAARIPAHTAHIVAHRPPLYPRRPPLCHATPFPCHHRPPLCPRRPASVPTPPVPLPTRPPCAHPPPLYPRRPPCTHAAHPCAHAAPHTRPWRPAAAKVTGAAASSPPRRECHNKQRSHLVAPRSAAPCPSAAPSAIPPALPSPAAICDAIPPPIFFSCLLSQAVIIAHSSRSHGVEAEPQNPAHPQAQNVPVTSAWACSSGSLAASYFPANKYPDRRHKVACARPATTSIGKKTAEWGTRGDATLVTTLVTPLPLSSPLPRTKCHHHPPTPSNLQYARLASPPRPTSTLQTLRT
ncbi:hypothetical protein C7M84_010306 [Penaeus vannamei]|uniref:Uncharacterized protein n=1 Tax=Penaeus vannamei TaxID=6689 RepID=A0A423T4F5_PENVA|nr:hypothetical protein C7M84_010306 [Penaeus vannamei]